MAYNEKKTSRAHTRTRETTPLAQRRTHRSLGGRVRHHAGVALLARDGRDVADAAVALLSLGQHDRQHRLAHQERSSGVHAEHPLEVLALDLVRLDASSTCARHGITGT